MILGGILKFRTGNRQSVSIGQTKPVDIYEPGKNTVKITFEVTENKETVS